MTKKAKIEKAIITDQAGLTIYHGYPIVDKITAAEKIVFIEPGTKLEVRIFEQGFKWLGHWEIIAPYRPYQELAKDLVKGHQQEEIDALGIPDLRIPVFDPRLVFMKGTAKAQKTWTRYQILRKLWDPRIAFLAAVWENKPCIKPLPAGKWIK